jgi:VWFA-related protein
MPISSCGRTRLVISLLILPAIGAPQASPTQPAPNQVVIEARTRLVLLNVVVKDKHGKPVEDLKRDDFVLRDDGQPQKISLFALEAMSGKASGVSGSPDRWNFTNRPGPEVAGVTAFLFDELNTQLTDQQLAKKDFLHYLQGLPSDSRIAVFVLGDSLTLLHDFSQDMPSLLAALGKHTNRVNPEVSASTAPPASAQSLTGGQANTAQWDSFMKDSRQPYIDYAETVRATRTAAALVTIASHLRAIPGRKTLVWISGGFPIQLGPRNNADSIPQGNPNARQAARAAESGRSSGARAGSSAQTNTSASKASSLTSSSDVPGTGPSFESDVALAIRSLNEADVAVYPVDARGVTVAPAFQADRSSIGKRNKPAKAVAAPYFNYETLQTLAAETGGKAFHHINDLSSAIQEATGDARVSYSLAFSPSSESLDGSYHRLEVAVKREGTQLRYRPGYVAEAGEAAAPTLAEAVANPINLAGIGFSVHLDPVDGGYKASLTIDPRNITLELKDGKWTGSLQFLAQVGTVQQLTTIPLSFDEALFRQIQNMGLILGARVKTPPGTTGFSLGLRDMPSGVIGTVHVPL